MITADRHLRIGTLLFDGIDQIDVTGPFEVLSRLPNTTHRLYGVSAAPVRDVMGLRLLPDDTIAKAPPLDVLHVPGGHGQEALMDDSTVHDWLRTQAGGAVAVLSVCTGALLLGAAGLLVGRRATSHWAVHHLLPWFGAIPVNARVVRDGNYLFAAGVTGRHRRGAAPRRGLARSGGCRTHPARYRLRARAPLRQRHTGNRAAGRVVRSMAGGRGAGRAPARNRQADWCGSRCASRGAREPGASVQRTLVPVRMAVTGQR